MTQPLGPPSPPKPETTWRELRYSVRYSIPRSLNRTGRIVRHMARRRRRG